MSTLQLQGGQASIARRYAAKTTAVLAALLLVATLAAPAIFAPNNARADHAPIQALFGTVVAVEPPNTVTVATDLGVQTVIITSNDVFTGDISAVDEISEGDRFVGSVHIAEDGTVTAEKVLIVPDLSKTVTRHILGVILELEDGVLTIQDREGNTITIDVPSSVTVPPVGTVVTAVAQLDRATGRLRAQAFDRVEDAVQRIQEATDRATDEDLKEQLQELLEEARTKHLSALERARESLQRAQEAVSAAIAERDEAQRRLNEVQSKFDDLRQRYVQEAGERNERLPELRTNGTLQYDDEEWAEDSGLFSLIQTGDSFDDGVIREFAWTQMTQAIVPVEVRETDPDSPAITSTVARSVALPLNDVKGLIPAGSQVIVQYDPNTEPPVATLITVLPPQLPDAIEDALEQERLRTINGIITLVEQTPDLDAIGVLVVTNREHDVKVAAKVTDATEIEIDGEMADFESLAAGMSVEVEFDAETEEQSADAATASDAGRLNALRVRARTQVDDNDVHVAGVIAALDPETRTVGILTRDGEIVRAHIALDGTIIKDGSPARFSALEQGDLVLDGTRYNRGTLVLTRLVVQSPGTVSFSGTITGLDRSPDRITVATANGRVITVFIVDDSRILTEDGKPLDFDDLAIANRVISGEALPVQRNGETLLVGARLVVGGPAIATARGIVSRVDADAGMIAIATGDSATGQLSRQLVLNVADDNRSVIFKNDRRIRTLELVLTGDIVESVAYAASTNTIVKMSVVSPDLHRIRGSVVRVGFATMSVETASGQNVSLVISRETELTLNGRSIDSLQRVSAGDTVSEAVYIAEPSVPGRGAALRVTLIRSTDMGGDGIPPIAPSVQTTISGVIEAIGDDAWVIGGRKFEIGPNTKFAGERPQVGLVARATMVLGTDGNFVATLISVAGHPDTNPSTRPVDVQPAEPGDAPGLVRLFGKVQEVNLYDDGTIASVAIEGAKISVNSTTIVVGEPVIGDSALAVVRKTPAGTIVAVTLVFGNESIDAEPPSTGDDSDFTDAGSSTTGGSASGSGNTSNGNSGQSDTDGPASNDGDDGSADTGVVA